MEVRKHTIPVLCPKGDDEDAKAVGDVIKSGWWINGPKVKEFEKRFAEMVGVKYAIAVTSNTHGLDLILKAYDISEGEIISPTMSFATTTAVPLWNNCKNVLADVDPVNMNICPEDVKKKITEKTKAIIAVNLAGILSPIEEIRKYYNGLIIEDCAHACYAPGAGSKGDVAVWSFQAVKTMPTGDGGMITTNSKEIMEKIKKLYWFGIESTYDRVTKQKDSPGSNSVYKWQYDIDILGYKYYMIDLTAALGLSQMDKLEKNVKRRQFIQAQYNEAFSDIEGIQLPPFSYTVQHYVIKVDPEIRDKMIDYLKEKNIHTSVHYRPLHLFTQFKDESEFPVADKEWIRMITLPCQLNMTDKDIDYIIYWVKQFFYSTLEPFIISLKNFEDNRGIFYESFKNNFLKNINFEIKQENTCISNKDVIRGFHYQTGEHSQAKLLTVLNGSIKDILIDIREGETFGKKFEFYLSYKNPQLLYIPHGYAHGYSIYEDNTIVSYKTDALYNKESEMGFNPLSESLGIDWEIQTPIISEKDINLPCF